MNSTLMIKLSGIAADNTFCREFDIELLNDFGWMFTVFFVLNDLIFKKLFVNLLEN